MLQELYRVNRIKLLVLLLLSGVFFFVSTWYDSHPYANMTRGLLSSFAALMLILMSASAAEVFAREIVAFFSARRAFKEKYHPAPIQLEPDPFLLWPINRRIPRTWIEWLGGHGQYPCGTLDTRQNRARFFTERRMLAQKCRDDWDFARKTCAVRREINRKADALKVSDASVL